MRFVLQMIFYGIDAAIDDDSMQLAQKDTVFDINSKRKLFQVFVCPDVGCVNGPRILQWRIGWQ